MAALAGEEFHLDQFANAFLDEERVTLRAVDEQPFQRLQRRIVAEHRIEEFVRGVGRQGIEPDFAKIGLAAPGMLVLGTVVDEEKHAGRRKAVHQRVEEGLAFGVDPMQILNYHKERLNPAFGE
jgi:hypothetical protein